MNNFSDNIYKFFDDNTKKILINSQKISYDMKVSTGTDHLLLSLLITPNTFSHNLLKQYISQVDQIKFIVKIDQFKETNTKNNITQEFLKILSIAADSIAKNKKEKIKPEDLLLAIINYKNCSAYKMLIKLGIDIEKLKLDLNKTKTKKRNNSYIQELLFYNEPKNLNPNNFDDFLSDEAFLHQQNLFTDQKTNQKISYLEEYGTNLTKLAKENKLDKIIGREKEIRRIIQILCRRTKNNPVLIGEPGVGKTAIIEGLAQKIVNNNVPIKLLDKKIYMLDLASTVAGTMYRGQFETRLKNIINETKNDKDIILFIDEIHTVIGTGSAEGSMDTANILKPSLAKGEIKLIGATTLEEYRKFIEKDTALERRLQKIIVEEPTFKETLEILKSTKLLLEKFHNVKILDESLITSIKLSQRYINDRNLPDKAIDLLDEACSNIYLNEKYLTNKKINLLDSQIKKVISEKNLAIEKQDFAKAAYLRSKELKLKQEILLYKKKNNIKETDAINQNDIAKVVSNWTNIPLDNIVIDNFSNIVNLEKKLSKKIIGQNQAINAIVDTIKKTKTQLVDPNRPLGSFIFLGPTGVGKTELVKELSKIIFGSEKKLIKIDMSEFMEKHNLSRLVGAPPGYIGYEDAGKLTEAVKNNPYSIILLDEIEKAHPEVFNIMLQIMEDGYLTDAKGKRINFKNTIIIMTSNLGTQKLNKLSVGFNLNKKINYTAVKKKILNDLKNNFKPEFLNRIDQIIIFRPLNMKNIKEIVKLRIDEISTRLLKQNIILKYNKQIIDIIAKKSYNPEYGAREIRRIIDQEIIKPIATLLIKFKNIKNIKITTSKDKINITK